MADEPATDINPYQSTRLLYLSVQNCVQASEALSTTMLCPDVVAKLDSSCSHVPLEIWQKIFLLVVSSENIPALAEADPVFWIPPGQSSSSLILPRAPAILGSVSPAWRRCAHGMPELWNTLFVKVRHDMKFGNEKETPPQILELVKSRLSLSQFMPLKICIVAKNNTDFGRSMIRAIIPFSRRWETIHLYTPTETYTEFDGLRANDFPNLSSFNILPQVYSRVDPHDSFRLDQVPFFTESTSIRQFHTSLIPSSSSPIFEGLQEFHVRASQTETWWLAEILPLCCQLKVLTLSGYGITVRADSPSIIQQITLPNLETLILEHPPGREALLDLLILPKLKALFLGGRCNQWQWPDSILHVIDRLKERSEVESLERLWLYFELHSMGTSILVDTLRKNPLLKELRINELSAMFGGRMIGWQFFNALTEGLQKNDMNSDGDRAHVGIQAAAAAQDPNLLCPKLEILHLDTNSTAFFESLELVKFLERRSLLVRSTDRSGADGSLGSTLPVVHLEIRLNQAPAIKSVLERYKEWKERGYSVDVQIID